MKVIVRGVVYWPIIYFNIEKTVNNCISCMKAQKNPPRIVDTHWIYSEQPWSRIHVKFAGSIDGLSFSVVVDAHSKCPEIFSMQNADTH